MGKTTGFMEYERIEEGYKPVPERLKHYKEFVAHLTDAQALAKKVLQLSRSSEIDAVLTQALQSKNAERSR